MSLDLHWTSAQLHAFLDGAVSAVEENDLVRHLDGCGDCRERLATSAGTDAWWNDARQFLSSHDDGEDSEHGDDDRVAIPLDFLGPTDDPAMLGRVGPYEVTGVVGRGGTGIVLKAFERPLNRYVAIKVLSPHLAASAAARKRFAREGQAIAAVVHDHIVPVYAVDEHQGLPYLVMRYVPGMSLQQRVDREGPLELREILRIGLQTAAGLAAAHAQGLVHRDVKPANTLLENGIERVMLTDFGLARTVDDASLTCSGVIAGTPQYMAPEQARGEGVDHRTDLFSLGSVLYFMATGHSPFRAETTMGVLHRICKCTPRPIHDTNPDIPRWLCDVIERLHAKQPARRFQSADEVAAVLSAGLAQLQQPQNGWSRWRRAPYSAPWLRGNGRTVAAVAAVVAAIVGGVAWHFGEPIAAWWTRTAVEGQVAEGSGGLAGAATSLSAGAALPSNAWDAHRAELAELGRDIAHVEAAWQGSPNVDAASWTKEIESLRSHVRRLEREEP